jgi:hypothetical protein
MAQDCQLRSHYFLPVAFRWIPEGQRLQWWIVDWGELSVCGAADQPTVEQRHQVLDQVDALAAAGYPVRGGNGASRPALLGGVDTAFYPERFGRGSRQSAAAAGCRCAAAAPINSERWARAAARQRGRAVKGALIVYEQDDAPDRLQGFADAPRSTMRSRRRCRMATGISRSTRIIASPTTCAASSATSRARAALAPVHKRHDFRDCLVYALARAPALVRTVVYENGLVCPSCSQSMVPEVRSKVEGVRYLRCSKCQAHLAHDLAAGSIRVV